IAAMFVAFAMSVAGRVQAFEIVAIPEGINAVNLQAAIDVLPGENGSVQISTAPGEDGVIRRIEVISVTPDANPDWAVFALRNESDVQIERLLVAPFFRLPGSGVLHPDLGSARITALTPSHGLRPERVPDREADVFR